MSVNQLMPSVLLEAISPRHGEWNADNGFVLQETVIKTDSMLGAVVMASALRISVARGTREPAEVGSLHGGKQIGNESCVCLEAIQIVSTEIFLNA